MLKEFMVLPGHNAGTLQQRKQCAERVTIDLTAVSVAAAAGDRETEIAFHNRPFGVFLDIPYDEFVPLWRKARGDS